MIKATLRIMFAAEIEIKHRDYFFDLYKNNYDATFNHIKFTSDSHRTVCFLNVVTNSNPAIALFGCVQTPKTVIKCVQVHCLSTVI